AAPRGRGDRPRRLADDRLRDPVGERAGRYAVAVALDLTDDAEAEAPVGAGRFLNRELSWLDFNARVLAQAEDERVPLLERAKFLAIFAQNLDEFFQVRVAGLKDQVAAGIIATTPDGRTPAQQLLEIR